MYRGSGVLLAVLLALGLSLQPTSTRGQLACPDEHATLDTACFIGTPDEQGITLNEALVHAAQVRAYKFRVSRSASAAHIFLGDLWYDLDVTLYRDPPDDVTSPEEIGRWLITRSANVGSRVIQFQRPEIIVSELTPNEYYTLFVHAGDLNSFDPSRPFTVRVALGPPFCGQPARDSGGIYQLALAYEPRELSPFTLVSFNAFLAPPFTDLYDFDWQLDGRPVPGDLRETMQLAVPELSGPSGAEHRVRVTARGVREYPDPEPRFRHIPPTLSVECSFRAP